MCHAIPPIDRGLRTVGDAGFIGRPLGVRKADLWNRYEPLACRLDLSSAFCGDELLDRTLVLFLE